MVRQACPELDEGLTTNGNTSPFWEIIREKNALIIVLSSLENHNYSKGQFGMVNSHITKVPIKFNLAYCRLAAG
jgi:hypothetical protein